MACQGARYGGKRPPHDSYSLGRERTSEGSPCRGSNPRPLWEATNHQETNVRNERKAAIARKRALLKSSAPQNRRPGSEWLLAAARSRKLAVAYS